MRRFLSVLAVVSAFGTMSWTVQADTAGGGVFIPIHDGSSHRCIDVTKSTVSMSVFTAQLTRTDKFWKKSKSLGVKIDVKLLNQSGQAFVFPRGRQISVTSYKGDIGYLPMVFPITSKYSLINPIDTKAYVNIGLDVFVINIETKSGLAKGVSSFIDFSKHLPLPVNPYTQGVQLFGEFAQKIVEGDIQSADEKLPAAVFAFDLASSAADLSECENTTNSPWLNPILREGIVAVMWDYDGKPEDGFVRVSDVDKFCYYPTASKRISYAPKVNGACPEEAPSKFLNNPLVAFVVNQYSKDPNTVKSFDVNPIHKSMAQLTLTYATAEAVVQKAFAVDDTGEWMNSKMMKKYFDSITEGNLQTVFDREMGKTDQASFPMVSPGVSVREVETAIAIHRCGLVGISANDCI